MNPGVVLFLVSMVFSVAAPTFAGDEPMSIQAENRKKVKHIDAEALIAALKEKAAFVPLAQRLEFALAAPGNDKKAAKKKFQLFERIRNDAKKRVRHMHCYARKRRIVKLLLKVDRLCVQEQLKLPYKPWLTKGVKAAIGLGGGVVGGIVGYILLKKLLFPVLRAIHNEAIAIQIARHAEAIEIQADND